jgi:hypothetical protein
VVAHVYRPALGRQQQEGHAFEASLGLHSKIISKEQKRKQTTATTTTKKKKKKRKMKTNEYSVENIRA